MFEEFTKNFTLDRVQSESADDNEKSIVKAEGWDEFFTKFSGCSFNNGLYRTHNLSSIPKWNKIVTSAFPAFADSVTCFGYDWLGRQFALDHERTEAGEQLVLMFQPGTAEAYEIPSNFVQFHEFQLITHQTECLEPEYYKEWLDTGNTPLPLDRCAGYKVPLFLGGEDAVENLESSDNEVYWVILGQVMEKVGGT